MPIDAPIGLSVGAGVSHERGDLSTASGVDSHGGVLRDWPGATPAAHTGRISRCDPGPIAVRPYFLDVGADALFQSDDCLCRLKGVPLASIVVPISGVLAIVGGLSILLGYRAKLGAWLIVVFLVGVTPLHNFWAVTDPMLHQMQFVMFVKNLAMLGGALLISQLGTGPWSLDARKK